MRKGVLLFFALFLAGGSRGVAQDVVSATSGVLQYFEGKVVLDDKLVEHKAAVFPSLKNGSTLRTEKGRAELLLTLGVYLRVDENSTLRMVSNSLEDTRLELVRGSAILDNFNADAGDRVAIGYEGTEVRFPHPGIYRIDSDVSELQVYSGDCLVKNHGALTTVDAAHRYDFALDFTTPKLGDGATDEFYDWAANRSNMLADQSQMASAEQADAQDNDAGGIAGMFAVPPLYTSPGYPSLANPLYGYSNYSSAANPFYAYSPALYPGFASFSSMVVLMPWRYGGSQWAGGGGISHRPVINRWPSPTGPSPIQGSLYHFPATALRYPVGTTGVHPNITTAPRTTAPSVAPHAAVPHVGIVGHH